MITVLPAQQTKVMQEEQELVEHKDFTQIVELRDLIKAN
jgi:hypothetical protein